MGVLVFVRKMRIVKRITALNMAMAIMIGSLTGCGSFDTEDMAGASEEIEDITESVASGTDCEVALAPETPDETTLSPETYEDYMKLAAESYDRQEWETALAFYQGAKELEEDREEVYRGISDVYLQMDDVAQAFATLDEGIEKCGLDSFGQSTLHQRKTYVLAGTVAVRRKFIENSYDDDGNILSDCVSEYDENGNEIKSVYCRAGGEIGNVVEYQYDGEGNQIEYEYKSYDSDGNISIFSHETWAYDINRNEIEYAEYDENGNMEQRREYGYDADGNRIRETDYDKNDEPVKRTETEYDASGNEIQYMVYDQYGNCSLKIIKEYDGRGNQIKQVVYDNSTTIRYWYEREYDENDNEVRYVRYSDDEVIDSWYEKEYDENGNEVKFIRYDDGVTIGCWIEKEYDANENLIKHVAYDDEGGIIYMWEYEYDESGREICERSYNENGVIGHTVEFEYSDDEAGNLIKAIYTNYDWETGQKGGQTIEEYIYDDRENMTEYTCTGYDEKGETDSRRWQREYDADGRKTAFYSYDDGKKASYQSKTVYDESGLMIKYTGCDQNGAVLVDKETEYDTSGKVIKEIYYDADGNPVQYYENEYDNFGSVIRQAMYKDSILKSEKQINYTYHYIGNIDAEVTEYMDDDVTPEEYNLKQREIFNRFLSGQEEIRYCSAFNSIGEGKIVRDTITDLIDFVYYEEDREALEYTFLDMTGDGIEELVINCSSDNLYIIQSDHGILKVIGRTVGGNYGTYLVKYDGRTGVCCDFGGHVGANEEIYYFYDGKGKQEISLSDYQDFQEDGTESRSYSIRDNDSFESRDISTGEYDDVSSTIIIITVDWYPLEEPLR
ncbi:MAG: hypothetical protein K2N80_07305 [Lachnospiraceae bacterium]|nr:hypothetical protein [Lachnospiraceae bacterium]